MSKNREEFVFKRIVLEQFKQTWGEYHSSALEAEQMFASYGIKLPFQIYYKYKLPNGLTPSQLLMRYDYMCLAQSFKEGEKNIFCEPGKYTEQEMQDYINYSLAHKDEWAAQMEKYVDEIRRLNPELANVSVKEDKVQYLKKSMPQWATGRVKGLEQDFVHGVVFGFLPEDIEYFLNRTDEQAKLDAQNKENYGVGHVVAPQFRDALKNAMTQIEMIKAKQNDGRA